MCNLIPWKILLTLVALLSGIIFIILCKIEQPINVSDYALNIWKAASYSVSFVSLILIGGWKYIWHKKFNIWFFPKIEGEYSGKLISNYNGTTEIPNVTLTIKQSLITGISVKQQSSESPSLSKSAQLIRNDHGDFELHYIYSNEPNNVVRDRSQPHMGATTLHIKQGDNLILEGRYFNDRNFSGDMYFIAK